jgi:hypothetical protein
MLEFGIRMTQGSPELPIRRDERRPGLSSTSLSSTTPARLQGMLPLLEVRNRSSVFSSEVPLQATLLGAAIEPNREARRFTLAVRNGRSTTSVRVVLQFNEVHGLGLEFLADRLRGLPS